MFQLSVVKSALAIMNIKHSFWRNHKDHAHPGVRAVALRDKALAMVVHDRVLTFRMWL